MIRAWVAVISKAHVLGGAAGGFTQVCHGRRAPLARLHAGDWLVSYSPTTERHGGEPLRAFTAIGEVSDDELYPFDMGDGFVPFRRRVRYAETRHDAPVKALSAELDFIRRTPNWGLLARRGLFEIPLSDAQRIGRAMGASRLPAL